MKVNDEVLHALKNIRRYAGGEARDIREEIRILDNAGVFTDLDSATDYDDVANPVTRHYGSSPRCENFGWYDETTFKVSYVNCSRCIENINRNIYEEDMMATVESSGYHLHLTAEEAGQLYDVLSAHLGGTATLPGTPLGEIRRALGDAGASVPRILLYRDSEATRMQGHTVINL